jgi:RNA polymerase sigma-70 factor (ECF subfamily)
MKGERGATGSDGAVLSACIVRVAERGDREAFAALFTHFAPRVKTYLLRLGAGAETAEELAQETLLTVWRRAKAFDPARGAASTWIFTIARNLGIDHIRRSRRAPALAAPLLAPAETPGPDTVLETVDDDALIDAALADLPRDQAQVVALAFFAEKTHARIAAELGLPLGTVKSRLRLAMGRLRAALRETTP